jgi:hypothetical protein
MKNSLPVVLGLLMGCGGSSGVSSMPTGSAGDAQGSAGAEAGIGGGGAGATAGSAGTGQAAGTTGSAGIQGIDKVSEALSGTRLKAYWYTSTDGSRQFAGKWFDSTLNIDCTIAVDPTGKMRCLPTLAPVALSYYADAGCSTPVAALPKVYQNCESWAGFANSTFANITNAASCPAGISRLGAPITGTVYTGTPGACSPSTSAAQSYSFFTIGAAIDLATFAEVSAAHD